MEKTVNKAKDQVSRRYNSVCPKCGTRFNCGIKAGLRTCWCFYVDNNRKDGHCCSTDKSECLCPRCLKEYLDGK